MADINLNDKTDQTAFKVDSEDVGKKIKSVPKPEKEIGIDTSDSLFNNIMEAGLSSELDIGALESFTHVSQSRETIYRVLDSMGEDATIAAVLETYAEDATEYNDYGQIVWCESSNPDIAKYVTFMLDSMNIDKNIYKWAYSLCKYGDLYIRLFRKSDMNDALFGDVDDDKETLNEDVKLRAYKDSDKYTSYVEMVPNPAEMFELTRFGKTYGYIKADVTAMSKDSNYINPVYKYRMSKNDVTIFSAKDFVHACLEDNSSRTPEEVSIFLDDDKTTNENGDEYTYTVKRGQSLLYNVFKIWRQLMLLENSVLLNRITKSSIIRLIGVEVGDMDKTKVRMQLAHVKNLIEQKSAFDEGKEMSEYTNPGPIENNVYVATRNGVGALSSQQIGGDVDVKSLADLDYFKNKFFGALRVPKQYFGDTDDGAGFNGGTSLSIISARYAKMTKRIQNTLKQAITDIINLMLVDRGLSNYVNNFEIHMLPPTTQDEIDRRDNTSSKVQLSSDILNMVSENIEDPVSKLKIMKNLISNVITDHEITDIIQQNIEEMEKNGDFEQGGDMDDEFGGGDGIDLSGMGGSNLPDLGDLGEPDELGGESEFGGEETELGGEEEPTESDSLPSPDDLGIDMTDNSQF